MRRLFYLGLGLMLVVTVAVAGGLAARGASSSDSSAATRLVFGAKNASSPIVFGASISLTGSFAGSADYALKGYQLWVSEANHHGGILGRQIKMVVYDDQSSAGTAARLYQKLISEDNVDFILGPYASGITQAVAPFAEKYQKVMVGPEASASSIYDDTKWNVQAITSADRYLVAVDDLAKKGGYTKIALFTNNTPATTRMCAAVKARALAYHMDVVFEKTYPNGTSDFSSLVLAAKGENPTTVVGCTYLPDSIAITRELNSQGVKPKLLAFSIGPVEPDFGKSLGDLANGVLGSTTWWASLKTKGNKGFVTDFTKKFGKPPEYHAAASYGALQALGAAIKQTKSLDQGKIRAAIGKLQIRTVNGPFKIDATGHQSGYKSYLMQWINGQQKLVWPPKIREAPAKLPSR